MKKSNRDSLKQTGKHLLKCGSIIVALWLLQGPLLELIHTVIVASILSKIQTGTIALIALIIVSVYAIVKIVEKIFFEKFFPTFNSLITSISIVSVYFLLLRNNSFFNSIKISKYSLIAYSDLLIPYIIYVTASFTYKESLKIDSSKNSFIEDDAYKLLNIDVFGRKPFAKRIADLICNSITEKAFAISVVGNWGSGKSVFMNLIRQELNESNEVIDFNPWKVSDLKKIIEDFFLTLSNRLSKYSSNAAKELKSYASKILELDDNALNKLINGTIELWGDEKSIEEDYESVNRKIKDTGKRFVVLIDDIDRLTGTEILQILKLIRNSANFGNVFFIVTVDYEYVIRSIENTKEVSLEEQYLQKIFQYELVLPPIKKSFIKETFKTLMKYDSLLPYDREEMDLALNRLISEVDTANSIFYDLDFEGSFQLAIDNLRDLIRFINTFKISYEILKGEIDLYDLVMIELIKLRSIKVYNLIGSRKILKKTENHSPRKVEIDDKEFGALVVGLNTSELNRIKKLCGSMFSVHNDGTQSKRSIIYPENIDIYFNYELYPQVPLKEFRQLRNDSVQVIILKVRKWESEGKTYAISNLLQEFRDFKDWETFKKFIHVFLILGDSPNKQEWLTHSYSFFRNQDTINNILDEGHQMPSKEVIESFLEEVFKYSDISSFAKSEFASFFIEESRKEDKFYFKDKNFWITQANLALERYLTEIQAFERIIYEFMFNSISEIEPETRKIIIDRDACQMVNHFIKEHSDSYLRTVIRPSYYPPDDIWTFDPFIEQIFGSFEEFEQLLKSSSSDDKFIRLAKKYLPAYKAVLNEQTKSFKVDTEDRKSLLELQKSLL